MVRQKAFACKLLTCSVAIMIICLLYKDNLRFVSAAEAAYVLPSYFAESIVNMPLNSAVRNYKFTVGADGVYVNGGSVVSYSSGTYSFSFDTGNLVTSSYRIVDYLKYDHFNVYYNPSMYCEMNFQNNTQFIITDTHYSVRPYILVSGEKHYLVPDMFNTITVQPVHGDLAISFGADIDVNISFDGYSTSNDIMRTIFSKADLNVVFGQNSYTIYGNRYITTGEQAIIEALNGLDTNIEIQIEQSDQDIEIQQEQNKLQSEQNELIDQGNKLQQESNETQKNIFEKITDFFDNFFSRLGEFLLGLIVPSAEDLTSFLDEVNEWFSDRLGFIWYPFGFAVDAVSALAGGDANTQFTVPALQINMLGGTYTIWNEMSIDIDAFDIFKYVRLFTSFICVGGIVALAYNKWDEWIGGHGVG